MQTTGLDESQAGIKIARRNINKLRSADKWRGTKSLLMKVKESEKDGLKLNTQKTKIMTSGSITSWQMEGEKMKAVTFSWAPDHCRW